MFDEFMGMPMHPLLVHAAVVFVPLLVLAAVVYALVPRLRPRVGWVAGLLAVAAPVSVFVATESGEALQERLAAKGYPPEGLQKISEHAELGEQTLWFSLALAVVTGLLLFVTGGSSRASRLPSWISPVLSGVIVVLAVVAVGYVYAAGDSGAKMLWGNV
ncbi:hypothetical protein SAMN05444365_101479 [Micromonospora pattaloongensis]|uniref:DUF2231 domain-containing protein n=1 Tax=Micromonospora pattaloongensis TaxID=405436 RepID=A0A1H3GM98_9ACTN|nr:DUF2231 domain-containing protein [Micromonospora pattaloongensis]SDY04443.1 hypothetical protein SAMN05444365_101479 [Micromonospora pattaloongensis]